MSTFPGKIAVFGAGAVGCYFGGMLARAGRDVVLIGRAAHVAALRARGLEIDSLRFDEVIPVAAASEPEAVAGADLVLCSVKSHQTEEAARAMAPHLARDAVIVSLQNGVDNAEKIERITARASIPAVVYVAVAMPAPGKIVHRARGELIIGRDEPHFRAQLDAIQALFAGAGVPCRVSENIAGELWLKLIFNVAVNAVTALGQATFRQMVEHASAREIVLEAARESMRVAEAAGVHLPPGDHAAMVLELARTFGETTSSMTRDIATGRRTEVDALNGYVARRGRELGVPTPVNQTLYALIKLAEDARAGQRSE